MTNSASGGPDAEKRRAEIEQRRKEAAKRALAEAEARRTETEAAENARPKEYNGPKGLEPTRYGDWERKGIASDF